jgi:hypothetical protein
VVSSRFHAGTSMPSAGGVHVIIHGLIKACRIFIGTAPGLGSASATSVRTRRRSLSGPATTRAGPAPWGRGCSSAMALHVGVGYAVSEESNAKRASTPWNNRRIHCVPHPREKTSVSNQHLRCLWRIVKKRSKIISTNGKFFFIDFPLWLNSISGHDLLAGARNGADGTLANPRSDRWSTAAVMLVCLSIREKR